MEASSKRVYQLVREHIREVVDLHVSLQCTQKEINEMKTTIHTQEDSLTNTTSYVERVTCTQREMEDGIDYVENQTRRTNLRIDGVAEVTAEAWADTEGVVRKTFTAALHLPEELANAMRIERADRAGVSKIEDRRREC